jgi:hypothetical protein
MSSSRVLIATMIAVFIGTPTLVKPQTSSAIFTCPDAPPEHPFYGEKFNSEWDCTFLVRLDNNPAGTHRQFFVSAGQRREENGIFLNRDGYCACYGDNPPNRDCVSVIGANRCSGWMPVVESNRAPAREWPKRGWWCRIGNPGDDPDNTVLASRGGGRCNPFFIGFDTGKCRRETEAISTKHNFTIWCDPDYLLMHGPVGQMNGENPPAACPDGYMRRPIWNCE